MHLCHVEHTMYKLILVIECINIGAMHISAWIINELYVQGTAGLTVWGMRSLSGTVDWGGDAPWGIRSNGGRKNAYAYEATEHLNTDSAVKGRALTVEERFLSTTITCHWQSSLGVDNLPKVEKWMTLFVMSNNACYPHTAEMPKSLKGPTLCGSKNLTNHIRHGLHKWFSMMASTHYQSV